MEITFFSVSIFSTVTFGAQRGAPNVTGEKMEITFFPDRGSNPVRWTQSPTLYHVAIKAGLYRKAVQVYHVTLITQATGKGSHKPAHMQSLARTFDGHRHIVETLSTPDK